MSSAVPNQHRRINLWLVGYRKLCLISRVSSPQNLFGRTFAPFDQGHFRASFSDAERRAGSSRRDVLPRDLHRKRLRPSRGSRCGAFCYVYVFFLVSYKCAHVFCSVCARLFGALVHGWMRVMVFSDHINVSSMPMLVTHVLPLTWYVEILIKGVYADWFAQRFFFFLLTGFPSSVFFHSKKTPSIRFSTG